MRAFRLQQPILRPTTRNNLFNNTKGSVLPKVVALLFSTTAMTKSTTASSPTKADIKLLARLRKETQVSVTKARDALLSSNNDYKKALEWLEKDAIKSGAKKAEKVGDRVAGEGVIAIANTPNNDQSAIIELGCETDFVARSEVFELLAQNIARQAMFSVNEAANKGCGDGALVNVSVDRLLEQPLNNPTTGNNNDDGSGDVSIKEAIVQTIGKLGENMILRRAVIGTQSATTSPDNDKVQKIFGTYVHGGPKPSMPIGKIGALVSIDIHKSNTNTVLGDTVMTELKRLTRRLAQQVVGINPKFLDAAELENAVRAGKFDLESYKAQQLEEAGGSGGDELVQSLVFLDQKFMFDESKTVRLAVEEIASGLRQSPGGEGIEGISVSGFKRFERGEGVEKKEAPDFAEQVREQLNN